MNGKLLEGKVGGVFRTVRSHLASFNMSPTCLGPCVCVRRTMALISDAKQATGEEKGGPVETGLIVRQS